MAKRYSAAFIAEAVETYRRMQPASFPAAAAQVGVHAETLRRWVHQAAASAEPAAPLAAMPPDDVAQLRHDVAVLTEAIGVLSRTLGERRRGASVAETWSTQ